jgi:hypothetical protein
VDWAGRAAEALAAGGFPCPVVAGQVDVFGACLTVVQGPYAAWLDRGEDLVAACRADPEAGAELIDQALADGLTEATSTPVADGFWYLLSAASPEWASPMEYGGHLLEADRAVLRALADRAPVCLAVVGEDPYFDALVDLPAAVRVWLADDPPVARPWP